MAEESPSPSPTPSPAESLSESEKKGAPWHATIADDLQRTTDSAIRSARSFQLNSSTHILSLKDYLPHLKHQYMTYEDAFFKKVKDELLSVKEHPAMAGGVAVTAALLLMRAPRRFLFRHTLGRFQSEEARFVRAEKNVKDLSLSVGLMKKESQKLIDRVALAEKDMRLGQTELRNTGKQMQRIANSVYKMETQAVDLMDVLRYVPGREALKLRAEVASMASLLKQQRIHMDKKIMKISDLGIRV